MHQGFDIFGVILGFNLSWLQKNFQKVCAIKGPFEVVAAFYKNDCEAVVGNVTFLKIIIATINILFFKKIKQQLSYIQDTLSGLILKSIFPPQNFLKSSKKKQSSEKVAPNRP